MNISPNERDKSIKLILEKGLTRPVSTWAYLRDMYRNLGLCVIFRESAPAMLVSFAVALAYILIVSTQFIFLEAMENQGALLFLFSPALFISMTVCTEAIERMNGLYEIKQTVKYTIRQITAFRLLCFSLVGTVFAVLVNIGVFYIMTANIVALEAQMGIFFQKLSIALCSLFLCSLLIITILRKVQSGWYLGSIIWAVTGMLLTMIFGNAWNEFLLNIPPAVTLITATISFILFLREIKKVGQRDGSSVLLEI